MAGLADVLRARTHRSLEDQNKVLEYYTVIINYCIIIVIVNVYYNSMIIILYF